MQISSFSSICQAICISVNLFVRSLGKLLDVTGGPINTDQLHLGMEEGRSCYPGTELRGEKEFKFWLFQTTVCHSYCSGYVGDFLLLSLPECLPSALLDVPLTLLCLQSLSTFYAHTLYLLLK